MCDCGSARDREAGVCQQIYIRRMKWNYEIHPYLMGEDGQYMSR